LTLRHFFKKEYNFIHQNRKKRKLTTNKIKLLGASNLLAQQTFSMLQSVHRCHTQPSQTCFQSVEIIQMEKKSTHLDHASKQHCPVLESGTGTDGRSDVSGDGVEVRYE
jgi:hypothetical protein